ncbi:dephospho-CoA kinase [Lewinella sp. LCG006]|uniref:dephospho-CoA kinase n=1 Tax=Lewinella sp. LCG006 TaxID=3231911 RepID=UPI00345F2364
MTLRIGITGGIGSGKTTVCQIFASLGIPVYYADDRAKWLMGNAPQLIAALKDAFGEKTYTEQGTLDRAYLAELVFNNQEQLDILNSIVHPSVREDGIRWDEQHQDTPYTLREAALLYESGIYQLLDQIITVTAPEALRIQRVMERDGLREEQVKARMDKQWPEEKKVALADFVIHNDGQHSLIRQVFQIHQQLSKPHA